MKGKVIYGSKKNRYFVNGVEVTRAQFDLVFRDKTNEILEDQTPPDGARPGCWPMPGSDAMMVTPKHIGAARQADTERGVGGTEYTSDGRPIFRDRGHRRDYLRAMAPTTEAEAMAMANELTVSFSGSYEKSSYPDVELPAISGLTRDVAGVRKIQHVQQIGTSEEALDIGELASLGFAYFKNLDASNYVELRMGTGASLDMIKLLPGDFCFFRFGSDITAPFAIANTAACYLFYTIFET